MMSKGKDVRGGGSLFSVLSSPPRLAVRGGMEYEENVLSMCCQ